MTLLDELESAPSEHAVPEALRRMLDDVRPVRLQLSRWRVARPRLWRAPQLHELVFVELRGREAQRTFVATLADDARPERLEGLPWLDQQPAEALDSLEDLVLLVGAARRAGAELVRWEPDSVGEPPALADEDREVPLSLVLHMLLGSGGTEVAMVIAAVVLFFSGVFALAVDRRDLTPPPEVQAEAEILERTQTGTHNGSPIYDYRVRYLDHEGQAHTTTVWATGLEVVAGDVVTVEYDATSPGDARMEGERYSRVVWWVPLVMMSVAFVVLLLAAPTVALGLRDVRLLRRGHVETQTTDEGAELSQSHTRARRRARRRVIFYDPARPTHRFHGGRLPGGAWVEGQRVVAPGVRRPWVSILLALAILAELVVIVLIVLR